MRQWVRWVAVAAFIAGLLGVIVLNGVLGGIDDQADRADEIATEARAAAKRAEKAAAVAVLNNLRIDRAALAACKRAERVKDATNRNGAIIYLVLFRAASRPGGTPPATRKSFRSLAALPLFQPRADCDKAAADPEYQAGTPRPFAELPHWKVRQALKQGR